MAGILSQGSLAVALGYGPDAPVQGLNGGRNIRFSPTSSAAT